ncbi:Eco57I restriction-modification methylase domain-containing protein [Tepidibacter hydrothermalis]|uniref:site-specific DNA-methyltransferase (adenine-specific) n=1 Tax=Tepidibacter hydrothermalis TaxID=3036126 RepID=A0ABY8E8J2_9FIRM|nr:N-6 DNA methylase [Tepidibacter hydrothermalis]WFD09221.1 N-6 DNA methylase [Tepidibacter hydrothermalis]
MDNKSNFTKEKLVFKFKKVHRQLTDIYIRILSIKYKNCDESLAFRQAYIFINKVFLLRIFQNNGFRLGVCNEKQFIIENKLNELLKIYLKNTENYEDLNLFCEEIDLSESQLNEDEVSVMYNAINKIKIHVDYLQRMDNTILGDLYEVFMDEEIRKSLGQFYTPGFIIDYILNKTILNEDIVKKPFIKVLDPACGSGHFIIKAYDMLKKKFIEEMSVLRKIYKDEIYTIKKAGKYIELRGIDYWKIENLHYHLLKNCIYGSDVDKFAIDITIVNLIIKDVKNFSYDINIIHSDSLVRWENEKYTKKREFWINKYDYIIGNPPYVGSKKLDSDYKKWLNEEYGDVFKDKSDIYYCFYKRILEVLDDDGKACIITPRYFIESPSGKPLRKYLKEKSSILEIVDFYGNQIFKGVGVAIAIFTFKKKLDTDIISVYKLGNDNLNLDSNTSLETMLNDKCFEKFNLKRSELEEDRWILVSDVKYNIYKKIKQNLDYELKDIATSFQGIITGCDKAFVLNSKEVESNNIETNILRKWVKNKNVDKYSVEDSDLFIIYSDFIEDESEYKNALKYIGKYKQRLVNRRECKKNIRKWYELQWGRDYKCFEKDKIMYPYKASHNKFAIDKNGYYCSADVYSFYIKDGYEKFFSLEYIVTLLNSKVYEFYFKMFAKKISARIYDYYPNSIMDMGIFKNFKYDELESIGKKIISLKRDVDIIKNKKSYDKKDPIKHFYNKCVNILKLKEEIYRLELDVDYIIIDSFDLTKDDLSIIYDDLNILDIDKLKQMIPENEFIKMHINRKKSIGYMSNLYDCDEFKIIKLRHDYSISCFEYEPWRLYNMNELYDEITEYLQKNIETIKDIENMNIDTIDEIMNKKCKNYLINIKILSEKYNSKNRLNILKKIMK